MLLATLLSYSRMSGDGETTALRSCGVSAYRLVLPALVLSLFVTGMTYVFNEAIACGKLAVAEYVTRRL